MNEIITEASIIGFVRYSQKITFSNPNKARDVFEPTYFEYRFAIFKEVTLKSFQQQTNTDFILLLLHSENMPSHYKERFLELEKTNLFLYNVFVKDTQESFDEAIVNSVNYLSFDKNVAITFRVDNDDAVQNNYIEKLYDFLKDDFIDFTISCPTMNIVKRISSELYMVEDSYFPANAVGLAYITSTHQFKTIFQLGNHHVINDHNKMIVMAKCDNGGLMTINGENELNSIDKSKAITLNKKDLDNYLMERRMNSIDLDCLKIYPNKFETLEFLELFVPPIFNRILKKLKFYFFRK